MLLGFYYTAWVSPGSCEFKGSFGFSRIRRRGAAYVGDFRSHFNAEHSPAVRSAAAAAAAHTQAGETRKGGGGKSEGAKTYRVSSRDAVSQHAVIHHGVRLTHTPIQNTSRARCARRGNGRNWAWFSFVLRAGMLCLIVESLLCEQREHKHAGVCRNYDYATAQGDQAQDEVLSAF